MVDRESPPPTQGSEREDADPWELIEAMRAERDHVAQANVRAALEMAAMYDERQQALEEQNRALEAAFAETRRASARKDEFLATISHELRTPLNGIIGMAHIMGAEAAGADDTECADTILESAQSLLKIINDLLDVSRVTMEQVELKAEPLSIRALVQSATRSLAAVALEQSVTLSSHIAEAVPQMLFGDELRLRQVLVNLVGNALNFTSEGSVTVACATAGDDARWLELRVIDTGCGIPSSAFEDIFESFRQLDNSATRGHGGTGLGLTISRNLVRLMGGEITVESTQGEGSTFTVRLPLSPAVQDVRRQAAVPVEPDHEAANHSPLRLLLVEDNPVNQRVATLLLRRLGHEVTVASSGGDALVERERQSFDAVLMDCQMPGMDGLEATRRIREEELSTGAHVPIIAVTANAMPKDRQACRDAGMDDFIPKPIDPSELRSKLDRVATQREPM